MASLEFECYRCGKIVSAEQHKLSLYCPACGTFLRPHPPPKHWLFQFNPAIYKWFDRIKVTKEPEQWLVSQNAKVIHKNDKVAIWCSGQKSGIYALGRITMNPTKKRLDHSQEEYFTEEESVAKFMEKPSALIEYSQIFTENPLSQDECNHDMTLSDLQIFMNPQGTNFYITREQWDRILELVTQKRDSSGGPYRI